jgi:hypothetical protein
MREVATLLVKLRVVDLVARTAEMAIREKLGLGDVLMGLARWDFWEFEAESRDPEGFVEELDREIHRQGSFYNLHKHVYRLTLRKAAHTLRRGSPSALEDGIPGLGGPGEAPFLVDVRVTDEGAGDNTIVSAWAGRFGGGRVTGALPGLLWRMAVRARDEAGARALAEEIVVTRERRRGILVNPHYQDYAVLECRLRGDEPR